MRDGVSMAESEQVWMTRAERDVAIAFKFFSHPTHEISKYCMYVGLGREEGRVV